MKVIFMGTPDFAVASLKAIIDAQFEVVAVVTAADKPAGRGQKISESAVKKYALTQNIPILQPQKLKDEDFIQQLKSYQADLQVVVAFRMLPEIVWNMPPKGTINLHASLLPQYRGAAPINHAIINGEKETGVTTFFIKHEIDTGDIILTEKIAIEPNENAGQLHDKLMLTGANLLVKTLINIKENNVKESPQENNTNLKSAPKIFKPFCQINWNQATQTIYNFIRGLSPYPAAFTLLNDKTLKIFEVEMEEKAHQNQIGSFISDGKTFLKFTTIDGFISLKEIQYEGKKRMKIDEFLRGIRL